jgi:hypothetical protein
MGHRLGSTPIPYQQAETIKFVKTPAAYLSTSTFHHMVALRCNILYDTKLDSGL